MSKRVQAQAALQVAQEARQSGYKTVIHHPKNAEFKSWLDAELSKGGKTVNTLHKEAKQKFPQLQVPAAPTIMNYIKRYYEPPTVAIPAYAPDYIKAMSEFDSYLKLIETAKVLWENYEDANAKAVYSPMEGVNAARWIDRYTKLLEVILDFEIKLKIRAAVMMPESLTLVNNNITNNGVIADLEQVDAILADSDKYAKFEQRLADLRRRRNPVVSDQTQQAAS